MKMRALKMGIATLLGLALTINAGAAVVTAETTTGAGSTTTSEYTEDAVTINFNGVEYTGTPIWTNTDGIDIQILKFKVDATSNEEYAAVLGTTTEVEDLIIPYKLDGAKVVCIAPGAFYRHKKLSTVTLPKGIEVIGGSAFSRCENLWGVSYSYTQLHTIEDRAFEGCVNLQGLENLSRDDYIKHIGMKAFSGCTSLEFITALANKDNSISIIEDSAFEGCSSLIGMYGGPELSYVGSSAFAGCSTLETARFKSNQINFRDRAFLNCTAMETVIFPDTCDFNLPNYIFSGCTALKGVLLPTKYTTLHKVGSYAFYNCSSLVEISVPSKVRIIGDGAFDGCTSLTSLNIPNVTEIGSGAFQHCRKLEYIDAEITGLPNLKSVGNFAFSGCIALKDTGIRDLGTEDTLSIGSYAYQGCDALESLEFPKNTTIGEGAFYSCVSLQSVSLPENLTMLNGETFAMCENLKKIEIPESLQFVLYEDFSNTAWLSDLADEAAGEPIIVNDILLGWSKATGDVTVPEGIKCLAGGCFSGTNANLKITSLTIPDTVTRIGNKIFYRSGTASALESLVMSKNIVKIGIEAFSNCTSLANIENIEQANDLDFIGSKAFHGTPWLEQKKQQESEVYIGRVLYSAHGASGEFKVPYGTTAIAAYAFEDNTEAVSVDLSRSVKWVDHFGLYCPNKNIKELTVRNKDCVLGVISSTNKKDTTGIEKMVFNRNNSNGRLNSAWDLAIDIHATEEELAERVVGDISCDGVFRANDIVLMKKYLLGATDEALDGEHADITNDYELNVFDYIALKRLYLDME